MKISVFFACAILSFAIPLHAQEQDEEIQSESVSQTEAVATAPVSSSFDASAAIAKELDDVSPPPPDTSKDTSHASFDEPSNSRKYKPRLRVGDHHTAHHKKTNVASKSHHKKVKIASHHHPSHSKVKKVAHITKKHIGRWICTPG